MKRFIKALLVTVICVVAVLAFAVGGFMIFYTPGLTADMSSKTGAVTSGASGYLYGIAQKGVPSDNMTESVDISTASVKVPNGLQHPIGDADDVCSQLGGTDYIVVYLQDIYSTWYYEHESIEKQRSDGTYDWQEFLKNDYLPKVEKSVAHLSSAPYSDKVVYCIYNECDNGVWFGETAQGDNGAYGEYNSVGEQNFFEAWKQTYDLVKSINPNALIGGPGFCDYDKNEIDSFMSFCTENDCVPQVMIYHELVDSSVYQWQNHVKAYRQLEDKLGLDKLPIIVTEYGRMQDNGMPGKMLQYITQIETSKVYGDNAYWRLANNLCDTAADANSPNANWWLYRWYSDMEGQTLDIKYQDLFKSNLGKAIEGKAEFSSQGFMGVVTMTDDEDKIDIICGGRDGSAVVKLKNLDRTQFSGKRVEVKIEEVLYKGISGVVNTPVIKQIYYTDIDSKTFVIDMNDMDESSAYHITVTPVLAGDEADYKNEMFIKRYEFEQGEISGSAYTYDSAYATTGEKDGMVGGMEKDGDGVAVKINVPHDGVYNLNVIYGNSNDGEYDADGKQNPDDRTDSVSLMTVDNHDCEVAFPNTIKSEYTDCLTMSYELEKGEHTVSFKHISGTIVLDSLLVMDENDELNSSVYGNDIAVLNDADRTTDSVQSFLVVAPFDGYYDLAFAGAKSAALNDIPVDFKADGSSTLYLMRGLNYMDIDSTESNSLSVVPSEISGLTVYLTAENAKLSGGASVKNNAASSQNYIDGISSEAGSAEFTAAVDKDGTYALTILYSNNDEGGKHDYNVDLIERYVTITANGKSQDVFCRNTYSWDTFKTVTCYVDLKQGDNTITLSNSGNNKFDSQTAYAPYITLISVNELAVF